MNPMDSLSLAGQGNFDPVAAPAGGPMPEPDGGIVGAGRLHRAERGRGRSHKFPVLTEGGILKNQPATP